MGLQISTQLSIQKGPNLWKYDADVENLIRTKKNADTKYGLKDMINNPWKLSKNVVKQMPGLRYTQSTSMEEIY